jgi:hypothetical protein
LCVSSTSITVTVSNTAPMEVPGSPFWSLRSREREIAARPATSVVIIFVEQRFHAPERA